MNILNSGTEALVRCNCAAQKDDLCRALQRNVNSLYLLAFMLTASHVEAEGCVESLIDKTLEHRGISRNSLVSCLKSSLIEIAVNRRLSRPRQLTFTNEHWFRVDGEHHVDASANEDIGKVVDAVIQLPFPTRVVFVITVLERQSDETCAALLRCSVATVIRVRELACRRLQQRISTMLEAFEGLTIGVEPNLVGSDRC